MACAEQLQRAALLRRGPTTNRCAGLRSGWMAHRIGTGLVETGERMFAVDMDISSAAAQCRASALPVSPDRPHARFIGTSDR